MSSKHSGMSDFVKDAVREKAARELRAIHDRGASLDAMERAREALAAVQTVLVPVDASVHAKVRKLRKLVDDASGLAVDMCNELGVDALKATDAAAQQSILDALKAAGIDPESVKPTPETHEEPVSLTDN